MSLSRKKIKQMGAVALLVILMFIMGCFFIKDDKVKTSEKNDYGKTLEKNDYGVFLNADASSLERFKKYDLIVIDAQYFTKKDIESLHQNGTKVYTYLNIGSVENFREYYKTYEKFTIGKYEHWDEEKWVDVSVPAWQKFIEQLSKKLFEKGVDGFFIDNCDVYYYAPRKSIFEGLTAILQNIMTLKKAVIINGGDTYVTKYRERYGAVDHIMTGVNQESVWSGIDFDKGTFNEQTRETREYYSKYLEACKADGMEVYLLEYTTDEKLIQKIKKYCKDKNFHFYISNSLELQ
ncbi:MAG: endo alpha-1,4 polygalactosaminidase [Lachnospiraceae bacterium]